MFLKHNFSAFLWALLILLLCGIPGKDLPDLSFLDSLSFDKFVHFLLFAVLVVLTIKGFKKQSTFLFLEKYAKITSVAIATIYGGLTEILQGIVFVDRKASIYDFFANFIGCLMGMLLFNFINKKLNSFFNTKKEHMLESDYENQDKEQDAVILSKNHYRKVSVVSGLTVIFFIVFILELIFVFYTRIIYFNILISTFLLYFLSKLYSNYLKRKTGKFDEIIFENSFKEYGAYQLRKNYNKRMVIAVAISVVLFVGFFLNILIQGFLIENKDTIADNVVISELLDMPPVENNPLPIPPKPPSSSQSTNDLIDKNKFTAPIIVEDSTEYSDSVKNLKKNMVVIGDDTLNTSGVGNSLSGTGSDVYVVVDELPKYPGGDEARFKFLQNNVKYPKVATYNGIKGVVYITFIVEKDGSLSNIKLLQGIGGGCDEEALRVARLMPKWTPGKRKGQPVRVYVNMPIRFFSATS